MKVLSAMQLKKGAKATETAVNGSLTQPLQFISAKKKDKGWTEWNLDWFEMRGMDQLRRNARRILKNYKLAKGIIDKTDYIVEEDNEYGELMDVLTKEDSSALELKFYPIVPNVINVLCGEFAKRFNKVQFRAVDDTSYNEMLEQKRSMIEENLLTDAHNNLMFEMIQQGADPESEEVQEQLSPQNLKTLPEIEDFFSKDYRSLVEEWASHQLNVDEERFKLNELEERGFRDMLVCDREFWHFKMNEDDYDVELWNPALTFYQKSPDSRYIADSNFVGKCDMLTVADVIDKYGYLMDDDQLQSLQKNYPIRAAKYLLRGMQNDGSYYDPSQTHEWNVKQPGLAYRQFLSNWENAPTEGADIVNWILNEGHDVYDWGDSDMMRVTTVYWKTQRKVGHLMRITEEGEIIQAIVDETYKISEKPIYNTNLFKQKTKDNLITGEHIDWFWINEVWGGVKIGLNAPISWKKESEILNPIYLGIDRTQPGKVPYQFKGDTSLYGCKLPVEGRVFSDRNTRSTSLVDLMKPYQVGYNMVNNQIADILVDELGTVIMFDQNALPRHSMGEDWGKNNLAKAYVAMKDFGMMPLDTSITNTENATNFNHYQTLNLEQTNRLMSRIQLANHFKSQAFEAIGINAQRLGAPIDQHATATGITQAMQQSYAQTEMYFVQHSDYLMPRVQQMRTDLAQHYNSTNPSIRLTYMTTEAEKVNFTINGKDLLMRDFNIFCTTKTNHRATLEQLKQMALTNNTTGASIYDLGSVIKADSIAEVTDILKDAELKTQMQQQQQQQQQQQMQQEQQQAQAAEADKQRVFESEQTQAEIQKDITVAEIRASGYGSVVDINQNQESDFQDAMKDIRKRDEYREQMNFKKEQAAVQDSNTKSKLNIDREKLATQRDIANKNLQIARENKNKYDVKGTKKEDKKDKKK
jgi:hypothetical protein